MKCCRPQIGILFEVAQQFPPSTQSLSLCLARFPSVFEFHVPCLESLTLFIVIRRNGCSIVYEILLRRKFNQNVLHASRCYWRQFWDKGREGERLRIGVKVCADTQWTTSSSRCSTSNILPNKSPTHTAPLNQFSYFTKCSMLLNGCAGERNSLIVAIFVFCFFFLLHKFGEVKELSFFFIEPNVEREELCRERKKEKVRKKKYITVETHTHTFTTNTAKCMFFYIFYIDIDKTRKRM